jgi:hypothetical protein
MLDQLSLYLENKFTMSQRMSNAAKASGSHDAVQQAARKQKVRNDVHKKHKALEVGRQQQQPLQRPSQQLPPPQVSQPLPLQPPPPLPQQLPPILPQQQPPLPQVSQSLPLQPLPLPFPQQPLPLLPQQLPQPLLQQPSPPQQQQQDSVQANEIQQEAVNHDHEVH